MAKRSQGTEMEKKCSECSEATLAQSLCILCNKWLCYQCMDVHQHQRASATSQHTDLHPQHRPGATQGGSTGHGPGSYPCSLLMCHSHRQEPLELFCESCDLLCCSSCQLSSHKNHRVVQISRALQDQQWLIESLMVQLEERRSAIENNAKQIEDRLHGEKIACRKAENQIKMAKMIMMNELNKRANLLIEQLQKISEDCQQRLEDQLQGAIEICGQLDHIQKFITRATTHHSRDPVLFSRALISLQMQQLLESSLQCDSWSPMKIKFNWDASYWIEQISTLGKLTVEGGNCPYPQGLACSSILRPQPITCLALPSVCHRGREPGCGYQACCEPQMCCLHGIPPQPDPSNLDKSQMEVTFCNSRYMSRCVQPAPISGSLHQSQQLQTCWDPNSLLQCPPPSSPIPIIGPIQLICSHGATSQEQATASQPHSQKKSYPYLEHQREVLPGSLAQSSADCSKQGPCQGKILTGTALQQDLSHATVERDVRCVTEELWEERCMVEEADGQTESRDLLGEQQQDRPVKQQQQQLHEQQRNRPALMLRQHRGGRRSTSLEVSPAALGCDSVAQKSRLSPSLLCAMTKRRSQSIPTGLTTLSTTPFSDRPAGCTHRLQEGAANKYAGRDSDGMVKETLSDKTPSRGHQSPLLSYKTEPDHSFTYVTGEMDYDTKDRYTMSRNGHKSNTDVQRDSGRTRVPVVCLERLKILVSQLPPHCRRQSDPFPVSRTERNETLSQQRRPHDATPEGIAGGCATTRTTYSTRPPSNAERSNCYQSRVHSTTSEFDHWGKTSSHKASMLSFTDPKYVPKSYSAPDSDSDPRSALEEDVGVSWASSSEVELECLAEGKSVTTGELGLCAETDIARDSEPSLEYEADPESYAGAGSEDAESGGAETESDTQPDCNPSFQAETDSDVVSDQRPDSQGSVASELNIDSEYEHATDDPRPLHSDMEEESHIGPGQRPLLIANPVAQRCTEAQSIQDNTEMESEDFCAVCLIGGDLLCCDCCPKVFHLSCHIPSLLSFPSGDWLCSLCRDVAQPEVEYNCENERRPEGHTMAPGLLACDQRRCERLTLLILSNVLSAPFQEPVSPLARHYYQIIKRPMDLSMIRAKLNRGNVRRYKSPELFVADVHLMFRNCAKFNYPDSEVAHAGRSLEAFFSSKLKDVFPDRVFPAAQVDSDSDEYDETYRAAEGGLRWPERRARCHRKRKRRNSLKSRRHHF